MVSKFIELLWLPCLSREEKIVNFRSQKSTRELRATLVSLINVHSNKTEYAFQISDRDKMTIFLKEILKIQSFQK